MITSLLLLLTIDAHAFPLRKFVTDYCTMFIEGPKEHPEAWKDCCIEHDMYYWAGGTLVDRKRADLRLKECVRNQGYPEYANLIYSGVILGHASPIKNEYHWNHGWFGKHQNTALTVKEKEMVRNYIVQTNFPDEVIALFLQNF